MNIFFKSIRARLQLWYGIILVVVLAGFGITAYQLERGRQLNQVDDELRQRISVLLQELRPPHESEDRRDRRPPPDFSPPDETREGEPRPFPPERFDQRRPQFSNTAVANGFYHSVWRRDGVQLSLSTNAPTDASIPQRTESLGVNFRMRGNLREAYQFTPPGECVLAGKSMARELAGLKLIAWKLTGVGSAVLLLGLAGGWWIATRAIRPVADISATAVKIAGGDLSQRISVADTDDELGQLASVLNSTFARLEAAFTQQARFTSDAAHELRTPVSVMLTQTQSALTRERSTLEYRETVEACQRSAQRMRRLIESLLALARLDAGQEPMKRLRFDLAKTASECIELVQPLAAERGIKITCILAATECDGDFERIGQVITNLLSNAIHYNKEQGELSVTTQQQNGAAVLTVADKGLGISAEDLPHVFERFYRADKSRSRSSGRAGLGLAISKAIIEAHGGTIEVSSDLGEGTTFTVRLPLASSPVLQCAT